MSYLPYFLTVLLTCADPSGRSLAGIVGSNPAGATAVRLF